MELGKVEKLSVRDQWKNEEYDFTPWLAKEENIQLLGDEINLDLEVEGVEIAIGSYKADIVARDGNNRTVIIENQLEKTDHKHLGQIITYASGVEAQIIVWVCSQVTDEHRQAIDWLNEVTRADIAFFACEIELWRIGDSVAAPKFNVVASPNDWTKVVKSTVNSKELSDTKRAHLDFWNGFKSYMEETGTSLKLRQPRPQHWYTMAVGRSKFHISLTTNTQSKQIGCEIYIRGDEAKEAFAQLVEQKDTIEALLGTLEWHELPDGQDCRIKLSRSGDSKSAAQWPELNGWLKDESEAFFKVFSPKIRALNF
jgi:hypothetical protein|tara:strand:- start:632 stop:1567 length:936 start_codon:yes stop_codon:yes gene_type:complete